MQSLSAKLTADHRQDVICRHARLIFVDCMGVTACHANAHHAHACHPCVGQLALSFSKLNDRFLKVLLDSTSLRHTIVVQQMWSGKVKVQGAAQPLPHPAT